MVAQERLNDGAIAVQKALSAINIKYGIFGGYAIGAIGGNRVSKDIDCLVNCDKAWLVRQLEKVPGFRSTNNQRPEYASFLWSDKKDFSDIVLIEFFTTSIPPVITTNTVNVQGKTLGRGTITILDIVTIYKGKLRATAFRSKHSDAHDLLWLEGQFREKLKSRVNEFYRLWVGLALKRYSHLEHSFVRLGVNIIACKEKAKHVDLDSLPPPEPNDVQNGILWGVGPSPRS